MQAKERQRKIEIYGSAYNHLRDALRQFPPEMWQFKAAPDDWSIHEIIVHLADSEANSFIRCRRAIAEPGSAVLGYDESRWAATLNYAGQSAEDALELFKWLRLSSAKLIQTLPAETWSHTIEHSENGTMTLEDWLDIYVRHVSDHIEQMQKVYEAWRQQHPV
jgi:hypothetical protein